MKKYMFSLLLVLSACSNGAISTTNGEESSYDYVDVADIEIDAQQMFNVNENEYFVYFYSPYCSHCNLIKATVIQYALDNKPRFWFMTPGSGDSLNGALDININLGATKVEQVYLNGYPTMMQITNHQISAVFQGKSQILDEISR